MGDGRVIRVSAMINSNSIEEMIEFGKEFVDLVKYLEDKNYSIDANRSEGGTYWEMTATK